MSTRKSTKSKRRETAAEDGYQLPPLSSLPEKVDPKFLLDSILKHASLSGRFYDTKFFAFSRRKSNGVVYAPKALYANGWLLKARVPNYFEQLLSDSFGDSITGNLEDNFPKDRKDYTDHYDFDEDSDLEDDPEPFDVSFDNLSFKLLTESSTGWGLAPAPVDAERVDDEHANEPSVQTDAEAKTDTAEPSSKVTGRIVVLSYTAFATWNALLWYLCKNEVAFKRLRSQSPATVGKATHSSTSAREVSPPLCSPKSLYRLADILGLTELKTKAKQDFISKIKSENIYDELLSTFTSTYDEIQEAVIDLVYRNTEYRRTVMQKMPTWIDGVASGELLHTKDLLAKLIVKLVNV